MSIPVICNVQPYVPPPPPPHGAKPSAVKRTIVRVELVEKTSKHATEDFPMRLGRHVVHDPASRAFPAKRAKRVKSVMWPRNERPFNQKNLGSCTGNAIAGCCSTEPFSRKLREADAVKAYGLATELDNVRGTYPPDDTGSSGLAAAKAAVQLGWCSGYTHAFGLQHVLESLTLGPCAIGMAWKTGCDTPDDAGLISWSGSVRGGHEVEAIGIDTDAELVWFANSWGTGWGLEGTFAMTFADLDAALKAQGDAVFPLL